MTEGGDFDKLGRGDVWRGQISPCLHQNHVFAVRVNSDVLLSNFISVLSGSEYGKGYFLSCAKRSTNLASINSSQLKKFPVLLPPIHEQEKICEILDAWSDSISVLEKIVGNGQRLRNGLARRLLSANGEGPKANGSNSIFCWGEVFDLKIGGTPPRKSPEFWSNDPCDSFMWLSIKDINEKYLSKSKERISSAGVRGSNVKLIRRGTVSSVSSCQSDAWA